ncbi:family S53 protease-like protein [Mycena polygramma]|nr:family S53 protease-like protein [Mycena polygramma]
MLAPAFVWASFLSLAVAYPSLHPRVMKQSRRAAPQGFSSLGAAPATQSMKLRFALASNDIPGLEKALLDVSTPSSPNYGKHLTKDEVNAYAAPSNESLAAVQAWLSSNNVTVDPVAEGAAGDWLTATVPVSKANDLLGASYENFQHIASGKAYARTLAYSLPASVAAHIDDIHPSTTFNNPVSAKSVLSVPQLNLKQGRGGGGGGGAGDNTTTAASCDTAVMPANNTVHASCANGITPTCLQNLYGIPTTAATQQSNSIAVAGQFHASSGGFNEQFAQKADLKSFLTTFRKDMSSTTTFSTQTLDGGQDLQGAAHAGLEANLDIQYTVGVATGVPVKFVSVGENFQDGELGGYLDIVNFLSAEDTIPEVMTTSYGENEADLSPALATKLCNAYMAMGARGTSILFASGDGGVEGGHGQQCTTFQVAFPAGCPYITTVGSVGGTNPETASAFSSGGFSNVFAAPDYQKAAVATYLTALGSTYKGRFNTSGRSYPDGENVQIIKAGKHAGADGTSCSSPIFASIIGLLTDQLIAGGKSPLGFLNPWLYANAEAFNDITTGSNSGDLQNSPTPGCGTKGFPAKAGWDPVTGLGTPNFAALKTAAGL